MVDHSKRLFLIATSVALIGLSVVVIVTSITAPLKISYDENQLNSPARLPQQSSAEVEKWSSEKFIYVWNKQLQGPLEDDKPEQKAIVEQKAKAPPVPKITIEAKLVGTLIDDTPDGSRAWIEMKGKREVFVLGDVIEEHPGRPTVSKIGDKIAVLTIGETDHVLEIELNPVFSSTAREDLRED